jgi:hypothetical protein
VFQYHPTEFCRRPIKTKAILLAVGSVILLILLSRFLAGNFRPKLHEFLAINPREQIFNLLYFEWFAWILVACIAVTVVSLLTGRPREQNGFRSVTPWRAIIAAIVFPPAIYFLLTRGAFALFARGREFVDPDLLLLRKPFLEAALFIALAFGASIVDAQIDTRRRPWWSIPYLLLPFPVLWWNFFARWLPSRYWSIWRVVLTAMMFPPLLLTFLSEPKGIRDLGPLEREPLQSIPHRLLDDCTGYQIARDPLKNFIYMNCDNRLTRYRAKEGSWERTGLFDPKGFWDEAAFNFAEDNAYLYIGMEGRFEIIDLSSMESRKTLTLNRSVSPPRSPGIHQAFDDRRNLLFIAENLGRILALDAKTMTPKAQAYLDRPDNQIWRILAGESRGELYVLQNHSLTILRMDDLYFLRRIEFEDEAYDMFLDNKDGAIYISFPAAMEVRAYAVDTLERISRIPAPSSVRPICIDHVRRWIVMGSYAGVISIRSLDDYRLIKRMRIMPQLRRIELWPDQGRLLATSGRYDTIDLNYVEIQPPFDFSDTVLLWMERAFRLSKRKLDESDPAINERRASEKE